MLSVWRDWADDVSGQALDCGHYLAEEKPREKDSPSESKGEASEPSASGEYTLKQALRSSVFWLLALAFFFFGMAHSTVTVHTVPALTDAGIPETRAGRSRSPG